MIHPPERGLPVTRERQQEVTLDALVAFFVAQTRTQPIVIAFEDVHWGDPTTLELIARLATVIRQSSADAPWRGCLVVSARAEFDNTWSADGLEPVPLPPLQPREDEELLVAGIEGDHPPSRGFLEALVREADGVPLFVEEVTRMLADTAAAPEDVAHDLPVPVPASLRELLLSRLDAISDSARTTAQLAAVLGREFSGELLRAVTSKPDETLADDLRELTWRGLLRQRRTPRGEQISFKHALVRDAAYETLLRHTRQELHRQVASTLQGRFPEIERSRPDLLAWHFEAAGVAPEAVTYRRRAGDHAMRRGAYTEAIRQFERAQRSVARLGDAPNRLSLDLGVTESLGTALFTTKGYAAPEVEATFNHAEELCGQMATEPPLRVLYGLWGIRLAQSDPQATATLLGRFRALAERTNDPVVRMVAHNVDGTRAFLSGDFARATTSMSESLEWSKTPEYRTFVAEYGYDLRTYAFGYLAGSHWARGDTAASLRARDLMVADADRSNNPYAITVALAYAAEAAAHRRERDAADAYSARGVAVAMEQKVYFWLGPLWSVRGWVALQAGKVDEAIALVRQGLGVFAAAGVRATYRCYLSFLLEALLAKGAIDDGLALADQNLTPRSATASRLRPGTTGARRILGARNATAQGRTAAGPRRPRRRPSSLDRRPRDEPPLARTGV